MSWSTACSRILQKLQMNRNTVTSYPELHILLPEQGGGWRRVRDINYRDFMLALLMNYVLNVRTLTVGVNSVIYRWGDVEYVI